MTQNIVSFSDATIKQSGKTILREVSIDVPEGSFIFLIGRTGSGKSSLIKTIYGDLALADGLGSVGQFDLTRLKSKQIPALRRSLGVVFQDFKLLPDRNIEDNLKFVLKATGWKNKKKIRVNKDNLLDELKQKEVEILRAFKQEIVTKMEDAAYKKKHNIKDPSLQEAPDVLTGDAKKNKEADENILKSLENEEYF